ncbi:protein-export chaperone SecB [Elizabethkingia anophelis]|uniref:protein-export chaperone SecB n=1 Tax=Elizabethkingia anophelis TaxID=1117645 RepID=UPI00099A6813|nr:protein-export chaperone SecB [Elizabethkingia anophelis]MCT3721323.1 protein-export chaperone SecB [Elizabethkingia anophelis]MCT3724834.1 protein-export chaperone SecB [Elizabethkingia anophelis]MCT3756772.1 protein-export chaperone SecB [Elizabethkingia anophelis]MCT3777756.1 protein-export chaperone SecB [Elizabethkingia anophelis]MCT3784870.1 protein-export chaperone SecB [Elizabethkingia anophelis]
MENKAAFSLDKYYFSKVDINFENKKNNDLKISFDPSGIYLTNDLLYELKFIFNALSEGQDDPFVSITCNATFKFENVKSFEDIPSYFYRNSIAIIFPYVRSFISTVTLQANIPPVILPIMNLSSLEKPLIEKTIQK